MRVLIVSCVFPPEPVVSSRTSFQVAEELVARGHEVTVVAPFPSRPAGRLYPGYRRGLVRRERDPRGFELVRCFSALSPRSSMASRLMENLSFGVTGGAAALLGARPDVVYANTWPVFATGILAGVARLRGVPLVVSVQDVYPESLVSQGRIRDDGLLARALRAVDGAIARGTRELIVISERFARTYRETRGVPAERTHAIPNWGDAPTAPAGGEGVRLRERLGVPPGACLVVYGGNVGVAAGVETVVEAFRHLGDRDDVRLLVAGEGSSLDACRALAAEAAPGRILFESPWRAEDTAGVLAAADVFVLPTRGSQSLASVPSKLVSYMLAERPVVAMALPGSDLADMVEESGGGWLVEPDRPEELAAVLREVASLDPEERARRGRAAFAFASGRLTRDSCLPRICDLLETAAA